MKRRQNYKIILGCLAAVAAVVVFGVTLFFIEKSTQARADEQMERADGYEVTPDVLIYDEEADEAYYSSHDIDTLLIIGTDSSGNEEAQGEDYQGNLSDFLLLAVIDHTDESYGFLQINRDTMTSVPLLQKDGTAYASADQQICMAHFYGADRAASGKNTMAAVQNLLYGMKIGGYYAIHMDNVPKLNYLLGGVTVTIPEDLTEIDPAFTSGATLTLSDEQAELFTRARMGVGDGTNSERMNRQLIYMNSAFEKARQCMTQDKNFAGDCFDELADIASTDLRKSSLTNLLSKTMQYTSKGIFRLEGEATTGVSLTDGLEHEQFYPEKASVFDVLSQLCGELSVYEGEYDVDALMDPYYE